MKDVLNLIHNMCPYIVLYKSLARLPKPIELTFETSHKHLRNSVLISLGNSIKQGHYKGKIVLWTPKEDRDIFMTSVGRQRNIWTRRCINKHIYFMNNKTLISNVLGKTEVQNPADIGYIFRKILKWRARIRTQSSSK